FRRLFSNSKNRKARRAYTRPQLLQLESRIVPANFQVTSLADTATGGTLREAIDLANTTAGNDTIDFDSSLFSGGAGTITLLTAQLPTILSASTAISGGIRGTLTITGPGASSLTISGNNGVSTRDFRIFEIVSGGNLSISGVTVSGAKFNSNNGGAFYNFGGTLSISNSTLSDNSASGGGAISNRGTLSITNSTLSDNSAYSQGGAIVNSGGTSIVNISNSTLSNNSAILGGAIVSGSGTLNISNSTLSNNSVISGGNSGGWGGAIYNIGDSTLSISNSTLSNNSAPYGTWAGVAGGAIYNSSSGAISISNSTVSNNTSGAGGAISSTGTGNITISNSTLSNNSATLYGGGAIYIYNTNNPRPTLTISNSTLSNNSVTTNGRFGGAIYNDGAILSISNSTLSNNSATSASAIRGGGFFVNTIFANGTGVQFDVGGFTGTNNLITSGTYSWATTVSRASLNLGLLQNNGGPTQTIALLSGSVAIGAGDAAISNAAPISGKDQRGYSRSSTAPSIGAFEFNGVAPAPAPTITSISPVTGSAAGGTTITILGTDFTGATAVTIGGVAASSFTVVNSTTITAITPAHAAGAASVEVTTATGTNVANSLFTYAATTTTALTSSVNPSVFGQPIIFTATVTGSSGTPTGTITFKNGSTTLGTGTLNGSGVATFSTSSLAVGSAYSITAVYSGDTSFVTSTSSAVSQVVNQASTTTALASSANPSLFGQAVTFTATVAAVSPGAGTVAGTVEFFDGVTSLGTVTLVSGSATSAAITNFGVSTHSITAVYSGDSSFVTSTSTAVSQVVNKASSATGLTSSVNPSVFGQPIIFTATVTGSSGTPSGTITFKNGLTTLGTATLNGSGLATFSTSTLAVGSSYSITAEYGGDSSFVTSTCSAVSQVVNKASSATVLIAAPNPSVFGESVSFTALVTGSFGTPSGTITFKNGLTTLGTGTLNGSGVTTFSTSSLAVGSSYSITAEYGGDSNFVTSTSSAVNQVVNLATANTPNFGTPTSTVDGFTVQISNYVVAFTYGGTATTGTVSISGAVVTVTGVAANTSSTATITTTQTNYANGSALVTATSNVAPTPPAPSPSPTTTPAPAPAPAPTGPMITGTPPPPASSGSSTVNLYDPATGQPMATGTAVPFPGFDGPITVVSGDFNNDGVADLVAGAGFGGGPAIAILDSQTGQVMEAFWAFDPAFTGGVFVAVQDTNGDGILDIIASAGPGGGPEVRIFNGANLNLLRSFYAYDQSFTGGVSVATIDFNNDGILDIVTGAGPGGAPHVKVYDGATNAILSQWYAYPASFTGGIFVAVGDIGNDGTFEVVTGAGPTGSPVVAVWDPFTGALLAQFMAYAESFTGGVRVAVNDGNGDGFADIVTGAGPGGGPQVNVFSFPALDLLFSFYSGEATNPGGVFVS
ncbi:MAG: hypothetical protein DWH70_00140, partial [Planctomycetota bacterium]